MMEWVAILVVSVAVLTDLLLIIFWSLNYKDYPREASKTATVAILVAARDEEANIGACLDSLLAMDYPRDKLKIWVGNDASTDATWQIISEYASKYPHILGVQITQSITLGNGKANVLAQLAQQSASDWVFITDADIQVPTQWVSAMLGAVENTEVALVTGTSLVSGTGYLAQIQRLDWLYATAMLKVISDIGTPVTTMGNNMGIKRSVYEEIGGFENLPFSVTEDLELFKQVKKNHQTVNIFSAAVLNKSTPQQSILELLIQRKRWMRGGFELPIQLLGILLVQAFYMPAVLLLMLINPFLGIGFWLAKWLIKFVFSSISAKKLKEKVSLFDSFVAELFIMVFSLASVLYYLWPGKVYWKGRKY